jgi:thiamine pyrophosphate-dependent acetolactate synthase large subunit-like protein
MRVFEAIAREVSRLGVRTGFALMSEEVAQLMVELRRQGVELFLSRHEAGAVGMADGFGRAAGSPAIAVIGRGPALTNAMTALTTASRSLTPLVVLAGAPSAADRNQRDVKHLEQETLLAAAGISHVTVTGAESAVPCLRAAYARASHGETVVVNLQMDVLEATVQGDGQSEVDLPTLEIPPIDRSAISLVADLLSERWAASRPLILAGRGAVRAGARRELIALGDRTGSLLGTTLMANSWFSGHPFNVGVVGSFSPPDAAELIRNADVVLAFGATLNPFTTYGGGLLGNARIVQFDADPAALGRFLDPEIAVLGNAREAASALLDELSRRGHQSDGYRSPAVVQRIATLRSEDFVDRSRPSAIDPRTLMVALDDAVPKDRFLVVDPGHHLTFSCTHMRVEGPDHFVFPVDFGSVGSATSVAIGVAIARRESTTVLAIGDGGLMMSLAELQTAVRYGLRLLVVVSNDSGFGAEVHYLQTVGQPDELARYENPSFEELGRALGFDAATVTSVDDIKKLRPLLLDCRVAGEVRAEWIEFYYLGKR